MRKFLGKVRVGLRDLESGELIRVYPQELEGEDKEINAIVKTWYYEQGCCESEEISRKYFVDNLNEAELKNHFGNSPI